MMLDNANNLLAKREKYFKASIPVAKFRYSGCAGKEPINEDILGGLVKSLGQVNEENADKGRQSCSLLKSSGSHYLFP